MNSLPAGTPKIVIVGGGAGGLELATKLGDRLGRKGLAEVTMIDCAWTHMWKPLLHEVAAGTLDVHEDELEYLAQAHAHHFRFRLGRMSGLDREKQVVTVAPTVSETGEVIVPERQFHYDTLVMAVGSVSNDFGVDGVAGHCMFLDTTDQAEQFQQRLLERVLAAHARGGDKNGNKLNIAIVGAGATGVELSAQLHAVTRQLSAFGLDDISPERDIEITIIEAAERILPGLPKRLSDATLNQLDVIGVKVLSGEQVVRVTDEAIYTHSGKVIPAIIRVWAAGIKAPDFLADLDGLEANRINQLVVDEFLQSGSDKNIYAIGDCAAARWHGQDSFVPPRAQAAHQQASTVARSIIRGLKNKPPVRFRYNDYGSLVSLGKHSTVGSIMGNLLGSVNLEGAIARLVYLSLYKMHQVALFGVFRVAFLTMANLFRRAVHPQIKLH